MNYVLNHNVSNYVSLDILTNPCILKLYLPLGKCIKDYKIGICGIQ